MSNQPKSLMTQYAEGALISRELQNMMVDYAADARFDRDLADDMELYVDRYSNRTYRDYPDYGHNRSAEA